MKILVTGASGFIGNRLCTLLEQEGHDLTLVSRKKSNNLNSIVCNLESQKLSDTCLEGIDAVFHLAAKVHDLDSPDKNDCSYRKLNLTSTIELARSSEKMGVKKFIFVSSVKAEKIYSSESFKKNNEVSSYALTKKQAEEELLEFNDSSKMAISIARPALVYGKNVKGNISIMLQGIESGWFPPLPDIDSYKSMIHVDDVARALLFILEDKNSSGQVFTLTDGVLYSPNDIYKILSKSLNKRISSIKIPLFFFKIVGFLNKTLDKKLQKLFSHEPYSSKKITSRGFKVNYQLDNINEKAF